MKLALVGGGGFRAPTVWQSVADVAEAIGLDEVVFQDLDADRLDRIALVIEGLVRERGGGPRPRTTTSLDDAVEGSAFVLCAIRVGGLAGRIVDERVPLECGVLGQETVGPGGIAFALRTVLAMRKIAAAVARHAPRAWLLNFTNPSGVVTEAIMRLLGDRAVGVCDSPSALCARVAAALGRPVGSLRFDYAGLNHVGWLLGVYSDGEDLLPGLLAEDGRLLRVEEARLFGADELRTLGMIPNEYCVYYERSEEIMDAFRRAGATRAEALRSSQSEFFSGWGWTPREALASWRAARDARHGTYMAEAWEAGPSKGPDGDLPAPADEGPGQEGYAAIAGSFIQAVAAGGVRSLILDVANRGSVSSLDDDAVVEVPCVVGADGVRPVPAGALPATQRALVTRVKEVERLVIRAAVERSSALALDALAAHPLVPSRPLAERIWAGYMRGHPSLRQSMR